MLKSSLSVGVILCLTGILLAACSSSSKPKAVSSSSSPILIGNIGQYSGVNDSPFAGGNGAITAWTDWTNAHGGIDGHKSKLFVYNDGGSASTSLTDAKILINDDHVDAIVGQQDPDAVTWSKLAEAAGVPVIGGNPADTTYFLNPDFYPDAQTTNKGYASMMKRIVSGGPKVAFIYCTESPVCSADIPYIKAAAEVDGGSLVAALPVAVTSPSFTAQCLAAKAKGANVMTIGAPAATVESVAVDCSDQGYYPTFLTPAVVVTEPIAEKLASIPHLKSIITSGDIPFFVDNTPATKEFEAALTKYAPSVLSTSTFTENDMSTWASGQLLAAAVKASGSITPAGIKNGLYSLHGVTLGGLTPPLTFIRGKATSISCGFAYAATATTMTLPFGTAASNC